MSAIIQKGIEFGVKALPFAVKALHAKDAASNFYDYCRKEDAYERAKQTMPTAEKVSMQCEGLFFVLQTVGIALEVFNGNKNLTLSTNAAAGAMDVARKLADVNTKKEPVSYEDVCDVIGVLCFRISDTLGIAQTTHKDYRWICLHRAEIEKAIKLADNAHKAAEFELHTTLLKDTAVFLIWSPLKKAWKWVNMPARPKNSSQPAPYQGLLSKTWSWMSERCRRPKLTPEQKLKIKMLEFVQSWEDDDEVSDLVAMHDAFDKCKISGKAIRTILIPNFETSDATLAYDKRSLEEWVKEHPNQNPPGWPASVPFSRDKLIHSARLQRQINEKLKALAQSFSEELNKNTDAK